MTNPEPKSRLNVPIKLVAQPTGDFALSGANGAHSVAAEGVAIAAEQVRSYRAIAQGVHLMAVKAEERIPLILERAGLSSRC